MKTLEPIQKTCKAFQTLAKIAMILSFIWAGTALAGLLCVLVWHIGGNIVGVPLEKVLDMTRTDGLAQLTGILLGDLVFALTDGLLFLFAHRYFKREQADGTPFTAAGAEQLMRLGIQTIVMPLAAVIISAVIYGCFGMNRPGEWDNGTAVVLGITLILFSLILRHGAELRESSQQ